VILTGLPRALWWTPAATILIARTLGHEVAHHVIRSTGTKPDSDADEQRAADLYAIELRRRMATRFRYRLGEWLIKEIADDRYIWGLTCWKDGERERALKQWTMTLRLDPDHHSAEYWRACRQEEPKNDSVAADPGGE
jgi:hypothetical protein